MPAENARIRIEGPRAGTVELDGHKIRGLVGVRVESKLHEFTRVSLDLIVRNTDIELDADLLVPEETKATLIALGWTPPSED